MKINGMLTASLIHMYFYDGYNLISIHMAFFYDIRVQIAACNSAPLLTQPLCDKVLARFRFQAALRQACHLSL